MTNFIEVMNGILCTGLMKFMKKLVNAAVSATMTTETYPNFIVVIAKITLLKKDLTFNYQKLCIYSMLMKLVGKKTFSMKIDRVLGKVFYHKTKN